MNKLFISAILTLTSFVVYHNSVTLMSMDDKMDQVLISQENTYDEFFEALSSLEARLAANNAKLMELNDTVIQLEEKY